MNHPNSPQPTPIQFEVCFLCISSNHVLQSIAPSWVTLPGSTQNQTSRPWMLKPFFCPDAAWYSLVEMMMMMVMMMMMMMLMLMVAMVAMVAMVMVTMVPTRRRACICGAPAMGRCSIPRPLPANPESSSLYPLSSSFVWLIFRVPEGNPKKELLRGLWVSPQTLESRSNSCTSTWALKPRDPKRPNSLKLGTPVNPKIPNS